jgi:hypothetical protein
MKDIPASKFPRNLLIVTTVGLTVIQPFILRAVNPINALDV